MGERDTPWRGFDVHRVEEFPWWRRWFWGRWAPHMTGHDANGPYPFRWMAWFYGWAWWRRERNLLEAQDD